MAYLDNIIIYFNSNEYFKYIKWVLQRLIDKKILIAIKKCKFYITKTEFYRFIIIRNNIICNYIQLHDAVVLVQ